MHYQTVASAETHPMSKFEPSIQVLPTSGTSSSDLSQESKFDSRTDVPLGKPTPARASGRIECVAVATSLIAMALSVATVSVDSFAWYLRYHFQIVVIGFLLSIMNISMMTILPTSFLRYEALFGESILQNFEAVLRNRPLASSIGWRWRIVLSFFVALPIGLSAIYKLFKDGHASITIGLDDDLYNGQFGLYAPPGVLPLGWNTGQIVMYNITMPFLQASTNQMLASKAGQTSNQSYSTALPITWPNPYGFNTLLLNSSAAALLDAPPPGWITSVQESLGEGDYWEISAPVLATVAANNDTVNSHRHETRTSEFWSQFELNTSTVEHQNFYDGWSLGYRDNTLDTSTSQPWCLLAVQPTTNIAKFLLWSHLYEINRQYCHGTWRITRGDTKLLNGSCTPDDIPTHLTAADQPQLPLTKFGSGFSLNIYFIPALNEFLAPFVGPLNASEWLEPTMATSVASMYWSRLAAAKGPGSPHWQGNNSFARAYAPEPNADITDGLLYGRKAYIRSTRPALGKSPYLYLVLVVQPLVTVAAFVAGVWMWDIPISRGFNVIAMLAGVDHESRRLLRGAGFSGELRRPVFLEIGTEEDGGVGDRVVYRLRTKEAERPGRLVPVRVYS